MYCDAGEFESAWWKKRWKIVLRCGGRWMGLCGGLERESGIMAGSMGKVCGYTAVHSGIQTNVHTVVS